MTREGAAARSARRVEGREGPRDPVAQRIRERRLGLGMTFLELAKRAGIRAPSHVFHIENGEKVPSPALAVRLANALGDDPRLYRAWAMARGRCVLETALQSAVALRQLLPGEAGPESAPSTEATAERVAADPRGAAALVRVPLHAEGSDPDEPRSGAAPIEVLRLDARVLPPADQLVRPFAYRLAGPRGPAEIVVISRAFWPLEREETYAVRRADRIDLGRVEWNHQTLRVLPGERLAPSEEASLEARDLDQLRSLIVGRVVMTMRIRGPSGARVTA